MWYICLCFCKYLMDEGNIMVKVCFGISIKVEVGLCYVYFNI